MASLQMTPWKWDSCLGAVTESGSTAGWRHQLLIRSWADGGTTKKTTCQAVSEVPWLTSFLGHLASKLWKISSANDFVMGLTPEHPDAGPASGKVGM